MNNFSFPKKTTTKFIIITFLFSFFCFYSLPAQVTLDSTFGNNGIVITPTSYASDINAIALQPDGKIVAAGYYLVGTNYHFQIARYNPNGSLDNTFGSGGIVNTIFNNSDAPFTVAIQSDGKIMVAGIFYDGTTTTLGNYHCAIVRYNTDGTLDNTFGVGGIVTTIIYGASIDDGIISLFLQADNKIIAGGFAGNQFLLLRYNTNGTLDNSFGSGGIVLTTIEATSAINSVVIQQDSKILVAGTTRDLSLNSKFALARYNSDGTLDFNFGTNGIVITDVGSFSYEVCFSVVLQTDNKIVVAGFSGDFCVLVRYNPDGSLDNSFGNSGIVVNNNFPGAKGLALQSDGKIVVSGNVVLLTYDYGYSITRFNTDGTPDSSFGTGGNIIVDIKPGNDYSQYLIIQPDDKIIVAGSSSDGPYIPADFNFTLVRFTSDVNTVIYNYTIPEIKIIAYPNPASEFIKIKFMEKVKVNKIQLFDFKGSMIKSFAAHENELNISDVASGQYLLSITTDKGVFFQEIVKQ